MHLLRNESQITSKSIVDPKSLCILLTTLDMKHHILKTCQENSHLPSLPDDLQTELRKSIQIADIQEALKLVERIRPQHESVAQGLTTLLHAYRY